MILTPPSCNGQAPTTQPAVQQAPAAAESIDLPPIKDWAGQRQFIHEATVGLQTALLQRFAAEVPQ